MIKARLLFIRRWAWQLLMLQFIACLALQVQANGDAWDSVRPRPQRDQGTIVVPLNKSRVIKLPEQAARISLGNPAIADILSISEQEIYINGKQLGTTNMILWGEDDKLKRQIGLEVTHDLQTLKEKFHQFLPREQIYVSSAGSAIVLNGEVSSLSRVDAAVRLAKSFASGSSGGGGLAGNLDGGGEKEGSVINLLQVGGAQQVLLEVKVAEVQRSFGKQMGIDFLGMYDGGDIKIDLVRNINSGAITQSSGSSFSTGSNFSSGLTNNASVGSEANISADASIGFDSENGSSFSYGATAGRSAESSRNISANSSINNFGTSSNSGNRGKTTGLGLPSTGAVLELLGGNFLGTTLALDIAQSQGLARILAEPNLTTLSGQQADFLSGGAFPVPTFQAGSGDNTSTAIEFKEFGIKLKFLPIVLDNNLISLKVNVSVSELSDEASVVVGASNVSSVTAVPSLRTRGADSTVEVPSGQTIAIAGLLSETTRGSGDRYPGLGDIPILGSLFRSQQYQKNQTELVIFVTPRLARPYDADLVKLPTEDFVDPSDVEFYLQGRLYGSPENERPDTTTRQGKSRLGPDKSGSEGSFGHDL